MERYALTIFCQVQEARWLEMYKLDDIQFGIEYRDGQKSSPKAVEFGIAYIDKYADQLRVLPE